MYLTKIQIDWYYFIVFVDKKNHFCFLPDHYTKSHVNHPKYQGYFHLVPIKILDTVTCRQPDWINTHGIWAS